jgi:hypothetical protein
MTPIAKRVNRALRDHPSLNLVPFLSPALQDRPVDGAGDPRRLTCDTRALTGARREGNFH